MARSVARCLLLAILVAGRQADAQTSATGEISGVVVDGQGQPMAAQRLELRGPATQKGLRRVVTTGVKGEFAFSRLPPGSYVIDLMVDGKIALSKGPLQLTQESMRVDHLILVRLAKLERPPREPPVEHTQAITFNPLFGSSGFYNGEYERRLDSRTTWGASATGSRWDHNDYRSVKALIRVYTRGVPLRGNFIGVRVGSSRATDAAGVSDRYFVLGAELGQTMGITGRRYELVASGGAGLNRLIGGNFAGLKTVPALRFNIGLAF